MAGSSAHLVSPPQGGLPWPAQLRWPPHPIPFWPLWAVLPITAPSSELSWHFTKWSRFVLRDPLLLPLPSPLLRNPPFPEALSDAPPGALPPWSPSPSTPRVSAPLTPLAREISSSFRGISVPGSVCVPSIQWSHQGLTSSWQGEPAGLLA